MSQDVELARIKMQKEELAKEWRKLEFEKKRYEQDKQLCDMQWKVMETELQKMAKEKEEIELKKAYYYQKLREHEKGHEWEKDFHAEAKTHDGTYLVRGDIFFKGLDNELAVKKRYKDLLKIFHPDNPGGDTQTLQVINQEYRIRKDSF